jgi:hypothetical protein
MKKRALILSSFVFLLSAVTFGQESQLSTTRLTKESPKSRTTVSNRSENTGLSKLSQNSSNTIESIDQEIKVLENVLIINKDDQAFDKTAVNNRIMELTERRKTLKQ